LSRSATPELAHQTTYSRTGKLDMANRKPFRTTAQKQAARDNARKVDGTWISNAPVSFNGKRRVER
jgi:hypothetical protein